MPLPQLQSELADTGIADGAPLSMIEVRMKELLKRLRATLRSWPFKEQRAEHSSNESIIAIYNRMKGEWKLIPADEPNYDLARKVFLDFNEFNLKNLEQIHPMYLQFIPKSLLPYPKNYIKCAYYLLLASLKRAEDKEMFDAVQRTGFHLFTAYPDYDRYKESLKHKSMYDDRVFGDASPSPRESFKRLYGTYQISEEEYRKSPNSIDATRERMIYDFGVVPDIEEDVH